MLGVAGDQQAATIGQACFRPGMCKSTYGTGCFAVLNTGERPCFSQNRLLTTIAYRLDGRTTYALEGAIFVAGAAVQWLRDGLGIIRSSAETGELWDRADPAQRVYLVPAFVGLGAPHWDTEARGALFGLTRSTGPAELARAALECVGYQTRDLLEAMKGDWHGDAGSVLRVDGGMAASDRAMQFLADICDAPVDRPPMLETTALGAAWLAGMRAGLCPGPDEFGGAPGNASAASSLEWTRRRAPSAWPAGRTPSGGPCRTVGRGRAMIERAWRAVMRDAEVLGRVTLAQLFERDPERFGASRSGTATCWSTSRRRRSTARRWPAFSLLPARRGSRRAGTPCSPARGQRNRGPRRPAHGASRGRGRARRGRRPRRHAGGPRHARPLPCLCRGRPRRPRRLPVGSPVHGRREPRDRRLGSRPRHGRAGAGAMGRRAAHAFRLQRGRRAPGRHRGSASTRRARSSSLRRNPLRHSRP